MRKLTLAALLLCATSLQAQYVPTCLTQQQQQDVAGAAALLAPKINIDLTDAFMRLADQNCTLTQITTSVLANIQTLNQNVAAIQGSTPTPGPPGAAATISVGTVTTGAPGSQAAVLNSGTSGAAVLNFTIPQGVQGIQGVPGSSGTGGTNVGPKAGTSSIIASSPTAAVLSAPCYPTQGIVGNITTGETIDFSLSIPAAGNYTLSACVASPNGPGKYHIEYPIGTKVGASLSVPNTGGYALFVYQPATAAVTLPAEVVTVRIVIENSGLNVAGLSF